MADESGMDGGIKIKELKECENHALDPGWGAGEKCNPVEGGFRSGARGLEKYRVGCRHYKGKSQRVMGRDRSQHRKAFHHCLQQKTQFMHLGLARSHRHSYSVSELRNMSVATRLLPPAEVLPLLVYPRPYAARY